MHLRIGSMLFLASALCAGAQKKLEFDAASVRVHIVDQPSAPRAGRACRTPSTCLAEIKAAPPAYGGPGTADPGQMTFRGVSMEGLLLLVFDVQLDQISAPDAIQQWLVKNRFAGAKYDITAKVPLGATQHDAKEMLKNLLIDRFGLVYHMQTRDFDGYRMTLAKGGPKLAPAAPADGPERARPAGMRQPVDDQDFPIFQPGYPNIVGFTRNGVDHLAGRMVTTADLLETLRLQLGASSRLEDDTGLTAKYDVKLYFSFQPPGGTSSGAGGEPPDPAPGLVTALEKQLGLKLEKIKAPTEVVVIDQLNQQPADN